ncbi:MAG: M81 family metallopeptidase [Planctomycetota bacterium]|nr:M81 family metallopeptidase [Planctomycetota bacterium]
MATRKRIGVIGFLHESNTFISTPTDYEAFQNDWLLEGESFLHGMSGAHHETTGFFSALEENADEFEAVPIMMARAIPYGTITAVAYDRIINRILDLLKQAGTLDGILAAPHGATVSKQQPDADGYWLEAVREVIGPDIPMIATLDPHGNLSHKMAAACDGMIAYRSNPHLDQFQVGRQAAELLFDTLRGKVKPTMVVSTPPIAINIQKQETSVPPCLPLYQLANRQLENPIVLTNSIMLGFPYSDVEEMGAAFIVVTDNDETQAAQLAAELQSYLFDHRSEFQAELETVEETVARCGDLEGPICLLDMGDNTGGGSPADSTILLHECQAQSLTNTFACLYDPAVVQQLQTAETGEIVAIEVGGKTDQLHGAPWYGEVELLGRYDGKFFEPQPRHGGATHCDQGDTVVVKHESGLTMMVTSKRQPPFSLKQLTTFDVDPTSFHILITKGVNAPIAAYKPVCREIIRANTPGVTTADMGHLDYKHRRRPLYPFEEVHQE